MKRRKRAFAVGMAVVLLGACSESDPPIPRSGSQVEQAAALAPPGTTGFYFTAWSELAEDPEDVLYASEGAEALFEELEPRGLVPMVSFDSYGYPDFEELWGWNTDDVEWEAAFYEPALYALRFREPIDVVDLTRRLEEREYSKTDEGGIDVYHHDESRDEEWLTDDFGPRTSLAVLNMAIVDDRTLLLSTDEARLSSAVKAILGEEAGETVLSEAIAPLTDSPLVMAFPAEEMCGLHERLGSPDEGALEQVEALEGRRYEALGIGMAGPDEEPGATVVVHYADAADAEEDLELREAAARGRSIVAGAPYEEVSFTVEGAAAEGTDVLLEFSPAESGTLGFAAAVRAGDLTFAAC